MVISSFRSRNNDVRSGRVGIIHRFCRGIGARQALWVALGALLLVTPSAQAQTFNFAKEVRVPLRQNLADCSVYLTPADLNSADGALTGKVDDGVGTPIAASLDPAQTEASIRTIMREHSREFLRKAQISLTGVGIRDSKTTRADFERMIARNGWDDLEIELKVFSVPRALIEKRAVQTVSDLWEQIRYFPPSLFGRDNLDFQKPLLSEIKQGIAATLVVEALNAVFVKTYTGMNGIDSTAAAQVLAVHFSLLASYTVFQKTLVNWILRNGITTGAAGKSLGIVKNMLTSLPFVFNYYLNGQWDRIVADSQKVSALQATGTEALTFLASQGPTLVIQGICYNLIISNGVWNWAYTRKGERNQQLARAAGNWVAAPFQTFIAMFLTVASFNLHPFFQTPVGAGTFSANTGQVLLGAFTIAGAGFFRWMANENPDALDFSLTWYEKASNWFKRLFRLKSA